MSTLKPQLFWLLECRDTPLNRLYLPFRLVYFDVEPLTGKVYVKNQTLLDREVRSLYSATLQARDSDEKPGSTVLEITVTDINDNAPVINRDSYLEFVQEGGELELKIEVISYFLDSLYEYIFKNLNHTFSMKNCVFGRWK